MITSIKRLYVVIVAILHGALFSTQTPPRGIHVEQPGAPKRPMARGIRPIGGGACKKLEFDGLACCAFKMVKEQMCMQSISPIERAIELLSPEEQILCREHAGIAYVISKVDREYSHLSVEQLKLLLRGIIRRLC